MKISDNKPPETISSIGSSLNPRLNHTLERIFNEPMIPTLTSTSKNEMNLTTNNFLEMIKENSELASRDISQPLYPNKTNFTVSTDSTPLGKSDPAADRIYYSKKTKRDEFQFSQESGHNDKKKVRMNEETVGNKKNQ